ncbi:hypothetical protein ACIGPN_39605 [Streptomyces afghaniensis]|uniref:hypothetical protein n=1 Tax=Streptomyces afghaniensis TaxID=66865 RepID=UPI0037D12A8A
MTTPVFVIHGVANRDRGAFETRVKTLGGRLDLADVELRPIFWGDLGGRDAFLDQVIPKLGVAADARADIAPDTEARPAPAADDPVWTLLTDPGLAASGPGAVRDGSEYWQEGVRIVAEAAAQQGQEGRATVRGTEAVWSSELEDVWGELTYLPRIRNAAVLSEIGVALASQDTEAFAGQDVRGVKDWLRQRLHDMDRAAGAVIGAAAGRLNAYLRTELSPSFARFAGDIAVYQRNQQQIQARVREALGRYDEEAGLAGGPPEQRTGGADNPARFICHSLGGVIVLDLMTARDYPLHARGLLTFGSQWPLFQLMDPRNGLSPYGGETPITLPTAVGRWINVWEPMDPLAFIASRVFLLSDMSRPEDRKAPHLATSGLWTHSAYWGLDVIRNAARDLFRSA